MSLLKSPSSHNQRSSPFRRPASPASPLGRPSTPPSANRAGASPMTSPSKLKQSYTVSEESEDSTLASPTKLASHVNASDFQGTSSPAYRSIPPNTRQAAANSGPISPFASKLNSSIITGSDPLSRLPPALLHSLRESFSVLDPASTGTITPASVHETLQSLGLDTSTIHTLFPPGSNQAITLPQYLNQLAAVLVELSPAQEILNAFSAFDDDDSGQVDIVELKKALLDIPPDVGERPLTERDINVALEGYTGRRILGRNAGGINGMRNLGAPAGSRKNGDVFRYQEFVGSLSGPGVDGQQSAQPVGAR